MPQNTHTHTRPHTHACTPAHTHRRRQHTQACTPQQRTRTTKHTPHKQTPSAAAQTHMWCAAGMCLRHTRCAYDAESTPRPLASLQDGTFTPAFQCCVGTPEPAAEPEVHNPDVVRHCLCLVFPLPLHCLALTVHCLFHCLQPKKCENYTDFQAAIDVVRVLRPHSKADFPRTARETANSNLYAKLQVCTHDTSQRCTTRADLFGLLRHWRRRMLAERLPDNRECRNGFSFSAFRYVSTVPIAGFLYRPVADERCCDSSARRAIALT